MMFQVDSRSEISLAEQIAIQVRAGVTSGELKPGERLPPARDLATALKVNLHTVLRAYHLLRDDELIEMRQGRGAWIRTDASATSARITELATQLVAEATKFGYSIHDLHARIDRLTGGTL